MVAGGERVGGDVHGVDRLARARVPRVAAGEFGVHRREGGADLLAHRTGEARCHLLLLAHDRTLHTHRSFRFPETLIRIVKL